MFNWTTTTIINQLTDFTNPDLHLISVAGTATNPILRIKRAFNFEAKYVSSIAMHKASDGEMFEVVIDCANMIPTVAGTSYGSVNIYIGLEGSEKSIYANDWYFKGKPFSVGYSAKYIDPASSTYATDKAAEATRIANQIVKDIKKFNVNMYGEQCFTVSANAGKLTIKGTDEYQRIKHVAIVEAGTSTNGYEDTVLEAWNDGETTTSSDPIYCASRGKESFGTAWYITKNLRLPTPEHTKFYQVMEDELPIAGAKYTQFIITYNAPSLANPGFGVIGEKHEKTETTHVFWVNETILQDFLKYIEALTASTATEFTGTFLDYTTSKTGVTPTASTSTLAAADIAGTYTSGTDTISVGEDLTKGTTDDVTLG